MEPLTSQMRLPSSKRLRPSNVTAGIGRISPEKSRARHRGRKQGRAAFLSGPVPNPTLKRPLRPRNRGLGDGGGKDRGPCGQLQRNAGIEVHLPRSYYRTRSFYDPNPATTTT